MFQKKKSRFGILALKKGHINVEHIIEALTIQLRENIENKKNRPIGEILLELGYMNSREIEELLEPKFEQRFGDVAVGKGFITLAQLLKGMAVQVKEDAENGGHRLLGEILMDRGFMNIAQVNEMFNVK